MDKFLSLKETAEFLGLKPRTLYSYRCRGRCDIPLVKRCGKIGILRSELEKYAANNK